MVVLTEKKSCGVGYKMTLFVRERDPSQELWDGPRTGVDAAASLFGADEARDIKTFASHVQSIITSYSNVYLDAPKQAPGRRRSILHYLSSARASDTESLLDRISSSSKVRPLSHHLHKLRQIKSPAEISIMREAAALSGTAHAKVGVKFGKVYRGC